MPIVPPHNRERSLEAWVVAFADGGFRGIEIEIRLIGNEPAL
jgi:hypothetical protein